MKNLLSWIRRKYHFYTASKYKYVFAVYAPEVIAESQVIIIAENGIPDSLVFKCPCGCHTDIYLNLLNDAKPRWSFKISKKNKITITPSIWRTVGCKSHFIVENSVVIWC
jgi:hypothetical protein